MLSVFAIWWQNKFQVTENGNESYGHNGLFLWL